MIGSPSIIDSPNISLAWAEAFQVVNSAPGKEVTALTVSFTGLDADIEEVDAIRELLDKQLASQRMQSVNTIANTIFPTSLWRFSQGNRSCLYRQYVENLPHYVKMEPHKNRNGTYFSRLIAFNVNPKTGIPIAGVNDTPTGASNQLEFLIQHCVPQKRRSYLQAAVFDPRRDHSDAAQLGFPCLQHISVVPNFKTKTLELNAFYATQQLFEKAYGNFLGLARLGRFIAGEVNLELQRATIFIGVEKMDRRRPPSVFGNELQRLLEDSSGMSTA